MENEPVVAGKNNKATQNGKQKGKKKEGGEQQIKTVKATQSGKGKENNKKELKEKTGKKDNAKQNGTGKG